MRIYYTLLTLTIVSLAIFLFYRLYLGEELTIYDHILLIIINIVGLITFGRTIYLSIKNNSYKK